MIQEVNNIDRNGIVDRFMDIVDSFINNFKENERGHAVERTKS